MVGRSIRDRGWPVRERIRVPICGRRLRRRARGAGRRSLKTEVVHGEDDGPFAVDVLTHPAKNPWHARCGSPGFDFYPDGDRAAVCTWDGDVWLSVGNGTGQDPPSVTEAPTNADLAADRLGAVPAARAEDRRRQDLRHLPRSTGRAARPERRRREPTSTSASTTTTR